MTPSLPQTPPGIVVAAVVRKLKANIQASMTPTGVRLAVARAEADDRLTPVDRKALRAVAEKRLAGLKGWKVVQFQRNESEWHSDVGSALADGLPLPKQEYE